MTARPRGPAFPETRPRRGPKARPVPPGALRPVYSLREITLLMGYPDDQKHFTRVKRMLERLGIIPTPSVFGYTSKALYLMASIKKNAPEVWESILDSVAMRAAVGEEMP